MLSIIRNLQGQLLADAYGPLHVWSEDDAGRQDRRPGDLYAHENPATGEREDFLLKTREPVPLPVAAADSPNWRYLGSAHRFLGNGGQPEV